MTLKNKKLCFLVVEDDTLTRLGLVHELKKLGACQEASSKKEALEKIEQDNFDLAFVDLDLETELSGLDVVEKLALKNIYSVVLSGREDERAIESAYQKGCRDYLSKPFQAKALNSLLNKFFLLQQPEILENFFATRYLTCNEDLKKRLNVLSEILISERPVLIEGETGTGKTLIAQLIHELRFKSLDKFVALNCAEIPENLLESELFGYEKGAFTGAQNNKKGKLLLADGGTLFLDEIATLPLHLQKKLLKALEEKSFFPLGAEKMVHSDFRLVSATCEDLKKLIAQGEFREDLYFRLEGFNIFLPPLRERKQDIGLLLDYFLKNLGNVGRRVIVPSDVREILLNYSWPGNIRELQKTVQIFLASTKGIISLEQLPSAIFKNDHKSETFSSSDTSTYVLQHGLKAYLEKVEEEIVSGFLKKNEEQVRLTLKELKISNSSFYRIVERLKLKGGSHASGK